MPRAGDHLAGNPPLLHGRTLVRTTRADRHGRVTSPDEHDIGTGRDGSERSVAELGECGGGSPGLRPTLERGVVHADAESCEEMSAEEAAHHHAHCSCTTRKNPHRLSAVSPRIPRECVARERRDVDRGMHQADPARPTGRVAPVCCARERSGQRAQHTQSDQALRRSWSFRPPMRSSANAAVQKPMGRSLRTGWSG